MHFHVCSWASEYLSGCWNHSWNCWSVYLCRDLNIVVISSFVVITYSLLPFYVTSQATLHSSTVNLHVSQSCVQSGFDFTVVLALSKGAMLVLFVLSFAVYCRLMDSLCPSACAVCMSCNHPLWPHCAQHSIQLTFGGRFPFQLPVQRSILIFI